MGQMTLYQKSTTLVQEGAYSEQISRTELIMVPRTTHSFCMAFSLARHLLLHIAILLSCWLLLAHGAESPTRVARRMQDVGCAQRCAHVSEMSRCLRISCRRKAMGPLIRFGKRDRGSVEAASGLDLTPAGRLSSQSDDILETLLSRGRDSLSRDASEESDAAAGQALMAPQRLDWPAGESAWYSAPSPRVRSLTSQSSLSRRDDDQLLMWLLRASKNIRHQQTSGDRDNSFPLSQAHGKSSVPEHRGPSDAAEELLVPGAGYWNTEPSPSHRLHNSLSPLTYHDLSGILGKRASSASGSRDWAQSITHPDQQMRRHQRGVLKHLIRFG
ncbi:hypothetical protein RRG08_030775 [Elysia crispata]|uniref:Uncharacterized protein n=1 Tax=Elysia crispata TaxID=231223 RepID=A0AAE0YFZ8_9GAST|nr:hypothetical protein RRG08_030775 [Elysia crispata]